MNKTHWLLFGVFIGVIIMGGIAVYELIQDVPIAQINYIKPKLNPGTHPIIKKEHKGLYYYCSDCYRPKLCRPNWSDCD